MFIVIICLLLLLLCFYCINIANYVGRCNKYKPHVINSIASRFKPHFMRICTRFCGILIRNYAQFRRNYYDVSGAVNQTFVKTRTSVTLQAVFMSLRDNQHTDRLNVNTAPLAITTVRNFDDMINRAQTHLKIVLFQNNYSQHILYYVAYLYTKGKVSLFDLYTIQIFKRLYFPFKHFSKNRNMSSLDTF